MFLNSNFSMPLLTYTMMTQKVDIQLEGSLVAKFLNGIIYVSNDILKFEFKNIFYDFMENVIKVLEII